MTAANDPRSRLRRALVTPLGVLSLVLIGADHLTVAALHTIPILSEAMFT